MKKLIFIIVLSLVFSFFSCKNNLISLDDDILDKAKDDTPPEIVVDSPTADSVFGQTVTISGTVSDNGSVMPVLGYQVLNDLGESKASGTAELQALETEQGVSGSFAIRFTTEDMSSDILISLTATDWNGNEASLPSFSLKYPGNAIPSLAVLSGNKEISLSWDAISNATEYRIYYTKNQAIFNENTASCEVITPGDEESFSFDLNSEDHGIGNNRLSQVLLRAVTPETTLDSSLIDVVPLSSATLTPRVSIGRDTAYIDWNPVQCAEGLQVEYSLWRSESGEEDSYTRVTPSDWSSSHFEDESIREGQTYYYRVSLDEESSVISTPVLCKSATSIPDLYQVDYNELISESGFAVGDKVFFTPDGNRLFIIDSSAKVISEINMVSGEIIGTSFTPLNSPSMYRIEGNNSNLFILTSEATSYDPSDRQIISLDISTQGSITQLDRRDVDYADDICLKGQTLYLCKSNDGIHYSMDVSNPSVLPLEAAINYGGTITVKSESIEELYINGDYMYSRCEDGSGVVQIAIYNTVTDSWTAKAFLADTSGVVVQGDLNRTSMRLNEDAGKLIILSDTGSTICDLMLWVYDIQSDGSLDLMEFKVLEDQEFLNITVPLIVGDTLYISRYQKTVQAVSIGSRIYLKESHSIPHYPYSLNPDGDKLLVYTYENAAGLVTLTEESPLSYQKEWSTGAGSSPLAFDGGRLFTHNYSGDIGQYACTLTDSLSLLGTDRLSGWGIAVYGDTLYLRTGEKRIELYQINSDGTLGIKTGEISTVREVFSLSFAGDYLIAGEKYYVEIFDISDLSDISRISEFEARYTVKGSKVYEDSLLIIGDGSGLCCYDFSTPESPVLQGSFYDRSSVSKSFYSVDVQDGIIYLGSDSGLFVLDLDQASYWTAAETPGDTGSASCWIEGQARAVKAAGDYLFFSNSGYLGAYSLTVPKKPVLFYEDPVPRYMESLALWGNGLFGKTTATLFGYYLDN